MFNYELLEKSFYKARQNKTNEYEELYSSRFNSDGVVKFDINIKNNQAFYLPTQDIILLMQKIYSNINKIIIINPNTDYLNIKTKSYINQCLVDEVMMTNDIEGIHSTRAEVQTAIDSYKNNTYVRLKFLVEKYLNIIGSENIKLDQPVDLKILYEQMLEDEISKNDKLDGELFRAKPVNIISATEKVKHTGLMDEKSIILSVENMLKIMNDKDIPILIKTAVAHYLFGYIHPFYDGNGRTARFISSYMLREVNLFVALRISYIINENRRKYYKAFDECNEAKNKGDLTPFIYMFLDIVLKATEKVYEELEYSEQKLAYYNDVCCNLQNKTKQDVEALFVLVQEFLYSRGGGLSVQELSEIIGKSTQTIKKQIDQFRDMGLIYIKKSGRINVYYADIEKLDKI